MTSQTVTRHWRRAVRGAVIGAMTTGLVIGLGTSEALADPGTTTPATPSATADASGTPQFTSADQMLAFIDSNYDEGAGGGQLSNLIKEVMDLRAKGFRPSKANIAAIQQALNYRPNQKPLIDALNETIGYQQKIKAQTAMLQQAQAAQNNNMVMGAGQMPADSNPGQAGQPMQRGWPGGGGQPADQPATP